MDLSIISFNIRCCNDKDGHSILERAPRLEKVIMPYDADVIGLQESTPTWMEHIEKCFGDKYGIFIKYRTTQPPFEGTPVLWKKDRFDCVDTGCFWLSDTPDVESRGWDKLPHNRICNYVILKEKASSKSFVFMSVHFGFGDSCQTKSALLMSEYADKFGGLPTIVVGDFNMTPQSVGYKTMTENFTDANAVTTRDTSSTFHGYHPEEHPDSHIDYCFLKGDVSAISQSVIKETVDGKYPSDHYGLFIKATI